MPVMVREQAAILFVHIPKCGGSSFERAMKDRAWRELLSIRGINASNLKFMRCSPQHMHAELLRQITHPELFDHVVTLVRDPISRLQSEYAWQQHQGMTDLKPDQWIEHAFTAFLKNPYVYDNHIRPQNEFLLGEELIFKLEENGVERALNAVSPALETKSIFSSLFNKTPIIKKLKETKKAPEITEAFDMKKSQIIDFYGKDYEMIKYPIHS